MGLYNIDVVLLGEDKNFLEGVQQKIASQVRTVSFFITKEEFINHLENSGGSDLAMIVNNAMAYNTLDLIKEIREKELYPEYIIFGKEDPLKTVLSFYHEGIDQYIPDNEDLEKNVKTALQNVSKKIERKVFIGTIASQAQKIIIKSRDHIEYIEILDGEHKGKKLRLPEGEMTMGGSDSSIAFTDNTPSLFKIIKNDDDSTFHVVALENNMIELNGTPTQNMQLTSGDTITAGNLNFKVSGLDLQKDLETILSKVRLINTVFDMQDSFGLSGGLDDLKLINVTRQLYTLGKTGLLSVMSNNHKGDVYFKDGTCLFSKSGDVILEKAFLRMAFWDEVEFTFFPDIEYPAFARNITMPTTTLCLEAEKQFQEWRNIQKRIPPNSLVLAFNYKFNTAEANLTFDEHSVLASVIEYSKVKQVLDKNANFDLVIAKSLISLREKGAISVVGKS